MTPKRRLGTASSARPRLRTLAAAFWLAFLAPALARVAFLEMPDRLVLGRSPQAGKASPVPRRAFLADVRADGVRRADGVLGLVVVAVGMDGGR